MWKGWPQGAAFDAGPAGPAGSAQGSAQGLAQGGLAQGLAQRSCENRVAGYKGAGRSTPRAARPAPPSPGPAEARHPGPEACDQSASGSRGGLAGGGVSGSGDPSPMSIPSGGSCPGS